MSSDQPSVSTRLLRLIPLGAWCGLVWYLSDRSNPGDTVGFLVELPDWLLHGVEYAVGGFLARHALRAFAPRLGTLLALSFCVLWALLDEWHQSFVPGRDAAWNDVVADVIGAALGCCAHAVWSRRRSR